MRCVSLSLYPRAEDGVIVWRLCVISVKLRLALVSLPDMCLIYMSINTHVRADHLSSDLDMMS